MTVVRGELQGWFNFSTAVDIPDDELEEMSEEEIQDRLQKMGEEELHKVRFNQSSWGLNDVVVQS